MTTACFSPSALLLLLPLLATSFLQITTFTSSPPSSPSSKVTCLGRLSLLCWKLTSIPGSSQRPSLLCFCPLPLDRKLQKAGILLLLFCLLHCCIFSIQNSARSSIFVEQISQSSSGLYEYFQEKKSAAWDRTSTERAQYSWAVYHECHHEYQHLLDTCSGYQVLCWAFFTCVPLFVYPWQQSHESGITDLTKQCKQV